MPTITIGNTVINFPDSGSDPNWAPALIDFAEAVQNSLNGVVGPADVAPQTFNINAYNPGTNITIPGLSFSTSLVRGVFIKYSVYRTTSSANAAETGFLTAIYNPNKPSTQQWEVSRQFAGDGQITFSMTDTGIAQFTTTALAGLSHTGILSYSATALLQS